MTQIRLTDMQLVLLATAAQREDGSLIPLPDMIGDQAERARKAVAQLIRKGLVEEKRGVPKVSAWREEGEVLIGVVITDGGRAAIHVEEQDEGAMASSAVPPSKPETAPAPAPHPTKRAQLIGLLERKGGASLDEMVQATGWLPHTTRAALTGLRKAGMTVESEKVDGERRYHVVPTGAAA